jgi:Phage P22-like portal protein
MAGIRDNLLKEDGEISRPHRRVPTGFGSIDDFLEDMRSKYEWGYGYNEHNILAGKEDAKFVVGNQWDPIVEQRRREAKKPVLTFNRLVAFIAQVVGNRLMNETEIRVYPDKAGTKEIAEIREGLIRSIFKNSHADFARDEAAKYQVVGGEGHFTLSIDYADDDVFEQSIRLGAITDPYSTVLDPLSIEPSGGDAAWGFVGDDIPQQEFKKRWPWAAEVGFLDEKRWNNSGYWMQEDCIRIVSYWRMVVEGTKLLALYKDGTVHDVSEMEEFEYANWVETRSDGSPYTREVPNRFARLYVCSGNAILEGPYDYPISSLPVYRVPGWELNDGERVHRWGLIRFLKDPQRLHNYWRSTVAEQLVAAPRNKWLTTADAVKGYEAKWRRAPTSDDPFLYYVDGETPPIHIPPPGIDAALVNEAGLATQDLKDISNIHEAALGMPSNEVSKVAIQQRQMVSDVGTYIYVDRRRIADERCATNINELIPFIYDTQRTLTIIGRDDKRLVQVINDPSDPNSDVTLGKYGVSVSVGPASETKRALAAEQMMGFVNAMPQVAEPVMHLIAEAQDWPKSGEFANIFKLIAASKFPGIIPQDELTPEMQQMQQQQQEMQGVQQQLADAMAQAELSAKQAKAANDEARANLAQAQAYKAILDARSRKADVEGKNAEREAAMDDQEFRQVMGVLDQHNNLAGEDRDFDERKESRINPTNGEA